MEGRWRCKTAMVVQDANLDGWPNGWMNEAYFNPDDPNGRYWMCCPPRSEGGAQNENHRQRHASTKQSTALILDQIFLVFFFLLTLKLMSIVEIEAGRLHKYIAVSHR